MKKEEDLGGWKKKYIEAVERKLLSGLNFLLAYHTVALMSAVNWWSPEAPKAVSRNVTSRSKLDESFSCPFTL